MGLSIVKAIVVCHGGSIVATSTRGRGTTISTTLPSARLGLRGATSDGQ
ncbi:MAG: hypothetical protein ABMA15_18830 [Vicinamibacterales bacterium]